MADLQSLTVNGSLYYLRDSYARDQLDNKIDKTYNNDDFEEVDFNNIIRYGYNVWSDGENIYYSYSSNQYVFIKSISTWITKTWTGLTSFDGEKIWSDGANIYYSSNSSQYVLNKSTFKWTKKTWTGLTNFNGYNIWSDGENVYYSYSVNQYVLNKSTSTWSIKTWTGLTDFYGSRVWSDGENIYYNYNSSRYVLDKSTSTWNPKTWSGITNFDASSIWSDGENIYLSSGANQYVLNKSTSTWSTKTWTGLTTFYGNQIWSDGENIYHSYNNVSYKKKSALELGDRLLLGKNGSFDSATVDSFLGNYLGDYAPKESPVFTGSISLGRKTGTTVGTNSVAEGTNVTVSGNNAHAEGFNTQAIGNYSHVEGYSNNDTSASYGARGKADHAEGYNTLANSGASLTYYGAHAEGYFTKATSSAAHAEGYITTASGLYSHAEGNSTMASGSYAHSEGGNTTAFGSYAHSEGNGAKATNEAAHAEGTNTTASGAYSHAEGFYSATCLSAVSSHAQGMHTSALAPIQNVFGVNNLELGDFERGGVVTLTPSTVPDYDPTKTYLYGDVVKVLNNDNETYTYYCNHQSYFYTVPIISPNTNIMMWGPISNPTSEIIGSATEWNPETSYQVGDYVTITRGGYARYYVAQYNMPSGNNIPLTNSSYWHTQDENTTYGHNDKAHPNYLEIVGNGLSGAPSNARVLDMRGNEYLSGDIYVHANSDTTGGSKVATESYVDQKTLPTVTSTDNDKVLKVVSGEWAAAVAPSGLPAAPTDDGDYFLECHVSSGVVTYNWVKYSVENPNS